MEESPKARYLRQQIAAVRAEIDEINADPHAGFRDDESACYKLSTLERQLDDELKKQEV